MDLREWEARHGRIKHVRCSLKPGLFTVVEVSEPSALIEGLDPSDNYTLQRVPLHTLTPSAEGPDPQKMLGPFVGEIARREGMSETRVRELIEWEPERS